MTTDLIQGMAVSFNSRKTVTINGMAKGSGMIHLIWQLCCPYTEFKYCSDLLDKHKKKQWFI